ncbi:MAG: class I tRNA ligase family protein, partial [Atopobiaceae bacterium]|nr:class I tRNA ligase family protein [Atopobiaceae bacterium]
FVLDASLRLLHPVMPFVTEKVWDAMPASSLDEVSHEGRFLMMAAWPEPEAFAQFVNDEAERDFELGRKVVLAARSTRARYRLSPKEQLDVCVRASAEESAILAGQTAFVQNVGRVGSLSVAPDQAKPVGSVTVLDGGLEIYVVVGGLVDLAGEVARLQKDLAKAEKDLAGVERTLVNEGFVAKAAPEVIEKKRGQAAELTATVAQLKAQLADLG